MARFASALFHPATLVLLALGVLAAAWAVIGSESCSSTNGSESLFLLSTALAIGGIVLVVVALNHCPITF